MTAKEYLSQIRELNQWIKQNLDEEAELRTQAETIRSFDYSRDKVQTSPDGDAPYVTILERIESLNKQIGDETDQLVLLRRRITREIRAMDNHIYSDLLYGRYVKCERFDDIADEMDYDPVYVRSMHGPALEAFAIQYHLDPD